MADASLQLVLSTPNRLVYVYTTASSGSLTTTAKRTKAEILADAAAALANPSAISAAVSAWPVLSAGQNDLDALLQAVAPGTAHTVNALPTDAQAKAYAGIPSVGYRLWVNTLGGSSIDTAFIKDTDGNIALTVDGSDEGLVELTVVHTVIG